MEVRYKLVFVSGYFDLNSVDFTILGTFFS